MFIVKKKKAGEIYYYLRKTQRINGKVIAKDIAYLGKNRKEAEEKKAEIEKNLKNNENIKKNMDVTITYFVHGTTIDNEKHISSGWGDVELSKLGIKQSKELPKQIGNKKFDFVFCSDLKRAVKSAEISFGGKYKIIKDKRLRECNYGDYNSKPSEIVEPMQEKRIVDKFSNGESYEDVKKRMVEFLNYLYENYSGKSIAIVAHKAPRLAIEVLLNNKTWKQAFNEDWRKVGKWQPGWDYEIKQSLKNPKDFLTLLVKKQPPEVLNKEVINQNNSKMAEEKHKIIEKNETKPKIGIDELANFCKSVGFVFRSSDIYGGFAGFWDYGPLGVELLNNIKQDWWNFFIHQKENMTGMDGSIISHPRTWKASGHIANFGDWMVYDGKNKRYFRVDHIIGDVLKMSVEGKKKEELVRILKDNKEKFRKAGHELQEDIKQLSLMFSTNVGPMEDESSKAYLRGETAQGMFMDFKLIQQTSRMKLPFGIAQIGKCFRNEIAPRDFLFRVREFNLAEFEFFINPEEKKCNLLEDKHINLKLRLLDAETQQAGKETLKETTIGKMLKEGRMEEWHAYWLAEQLIWYYSLGLVEIKIREHRKDELSHYSSATFDVDYEYPFGSVELGGIANRGQYDLTQHAKESGEKMEIFDEKYKNRVVAKVIEPTFGMDRALLAVLTKAYSFDEKRQNIVLKLPAKLAPVKASIFPLLKDEQYEKIAREVYNNLKKDWYVSYDDSGSIGKRYSRNDSVGTPMCITIDEDTPKDKAVTIRDRNTTKQIRVKISELREVVRKVVQDNEDLLKLGKLVETRVKEE